MKNENNLEDSKKSLFGLSRRGLAGLPYNARHKSLKQEPFVLNFLQFFYIHSLHPCTPLFSLQCAPLLPHCWAESIFTEMTANPNQHDWGAGSGKSLKCFKISDEYWSSIAEVFFSSFWGRRKLETLYTSHRWWARRPLIFRQVDGMTLHSGDFIALKEGGGLPHSLALSMSLANATTLQTVRDC